MKRNKAKKNIFIISDKSYYSYARITQIELLYFPYEDIENPDNIAIIPVWACRD